jgi:hypothetical protein
MKKLPIGTKVFDINHGWGEITGESPEHYSVHWHHISDFFRKSNGTLKGSEIKFPALSLTEYTLENGGFTPITEYGKPKVGDRGYFWDDFKSCIFYGKITKIQNTHPMPFKINDYEYFMNFSHEIPQEYIDYLNTLK